MGGSNNQQSFSRDDGIYRKHPILPYVVTCWVCGKEVSTSPLAKASHGKKHVRQGKAVTRTEYGYDGPRTVYEAIK